MAFRACVLADSISPPTPQHPNGVRLISVAAEYPREVLAEFNTHTIMSKSTSSSRATPMEQMLKKIESDGHTPEFGGNTRGMQAKDTWEGSQAEQARRIWEDAKADAVRHARRFMELGVHKQVGNRVVENYGWTRQVITSTQWANFFTLRTHDDAHPAFRRIARMMYVAISRSTPKKLGYGDWHLPFVNDADRGQIAEICGDGDWFPEKAEPIRKMFLEHGGRTTADLFACILSAVRCARTSYNRFDGTGHGFTHGDWKTFGTLALRDDSGTNPVHASPTGHQGTPLHPAQQSAYPWKVSNLAGWLQFRRLIPKECVHEFNPPPEVVASWGVDESGILNDPSQF